MGLIAALDRFLELSEVLEDILSVSDVCQNERKTLVADKGVGCDLGGEKCFEYYSVSSPSH